MMGGFHTLYRKRIDGTDFFESYSELKDAIDYIKSGKGPALIEANVVRLQSHSSSDDQRKYRDHSELEKDKQDDPIEKFVARLDGVEIHIPNRVHRIEGIGNSQVPLQAAVAFSLLYDGLE